MIFHSNYIYSNYIYSNYVLSKDVLSNYKSIKFYIDQILYHLNFISFKLYYQFKYVREMPQFYAFIYYKIHLL